MQNDLDHSYEDALRLLDRPGSRVHFMGIGGVGMAGLSLLLKEAGFEVDGCDVRGSDRTRILSAGGILNRLGHGSEHMAQGVSALVRTPATPGEHPEILAARALGIPVLSRGALLAALAGRRKTLAVAGTHGKTTTSAMLAHILRRTGRNPGYCIGGDAPTLSGLARLPGPDAPLVVEADESDGTLRLYRARIALVTNVDFDHMEHFRSVEEFHSVFVQFVRQADEVILGADDAGARRLAAARSDALLFGFDPDCRVRAERVEPTTRGSDFDLVLDGIRAGRVRLPVEGRFNVLNALGAFAAAWRAGCAPGELPGALEDFEPVLRRQQRLGAGGGVEVIADYAHHPTEIRELIVAMRHGVRGRLIAVFQPHRYTRTLALGAEFPAAFTGADEVVLLPVYAASEAPLAGGTSEDLLRRMRERPGMSVSLEPDFSSARAVLASRAAPGDRILVIGAGDIEDLGRMLAEDVRARGPSGARA
jgi:UDP-N-acetylmuramate--alanine ligase